VLTDVKSCYEGVEADVMSLIVGGDIIAVHNRVEFKSLILYPRGKPFLTKLSGTRTPHVMICLAMSRRSIMRGTSDVSFVMEPQ
jgi:hypothetical protein